MSAEARAVSQRDEEREAALARLEADGFIVQSGQMWRTTRRWQQAMARAAMKLYEEGDPGDDLRVPIALAIVELYSGKVDDEVMVQFVESLLPIEAVSLGLVSP